MKLILTLVYFSHVCLFAWSSSISNLYNTIKLLDANNNKLNALRDSIDVLLNNYYVNTLTHKSTEGKVWFEPSVIMLLGPEGVTNNTKIHIAAMQYLYLVEFWKIYTIFINHSLGQISATLQINIYMNFVLCLTIWNGTIQIEFYAMSYKVELYFENVQ